MARNKLVSPKETFRELTLAASFLKGSGDMGRKRAEGYIPCYSPLPYNTFPEGSSTPSLVPVQMCTHHVPGSSVVPPGKICRNPETKPFSRGLLKSKLHENKRAEPQKSQTQVEITELLRFQAPLQVHSMVAQFMGSCVSADLHIALAPFAGWQSAWGHTQSPVHRRSLPDIAPLAKPHAGHPLAKKHS